MKLLSSFSFTIDVIPYLKMSQKHSMSIATSTTH